MEKEGGVNQRERVKERVMKAIYKYIDTEEEGVKGKKKERRES